MPDTFKLRRFASPKSRALSPEEVEVIDYNFWAIEQGLSSLGAATPIPGGGAVPVPVLSHHNLTDLSTYDDHPQYLLLAGRASTQIIQKNLSLANDDGTIRTRWIPGASLIVASKTLFYPSGGGGIGIVNQAGGASGRLAIGIDPASAGNSLEIHTEGGAAAGIAVIGGAGTGAMIVATNPAQGTFSVDTNSRTSLVSGASQSAGDMFTIQNGGHVNSVLEVIRGKASQAGSLTEWRDSANNVLTRMTAEGAEVFSLGAAAFATYPITITNTRSSGTAKGLLIQNLTPDLVAGMRPIVFIRRNDADDTNLEWYFEVTPGDTPRCELWRANRPDGGGTTFSNPISFLYNGDIDLTGTGNIKQAGANAKKSILLMAAGGKGTVTAGCGGPTQVETTTNKNNYWALEFDTTTEESAFWLVQMPDNYDGSTITAKFIWTNAAGLTTETVRWGIKARAYADSDAIDQAFGTEVTVDDTWLAQGDVHNSPVSSAITIGGTPAGGNFVIFNVARKTASDNLTGDARLLAVQIEYGINSYGD